MGGGAPAGGWRLAARRPSCPRFPSSPARGAGARTSVGAGATGRSAAVPAKAAGRSPATGEARGGRPRCDGSGGPEPVPPVTGGRGRPDGFGEVTSWDIGGL
ncbi:hypothetical protein GCM10010503_25970 [Streptomyces lucensis JCM 4490]|uniref:Uncharacterized protein n=1 Tax=Streptomyces lucensis JCM 4490 TaxID=1306176 RepID=A0A918J5C4_9ACTN|nr:hypothetical protein GCM10010503_25970 [Streptomyces lucensis JCM 4490]